jgi:hypothetical protein
MKLAIMCPSTGGHEAAVESWLTLEYTLWPVEVDATIEGEDAGYLQKVQKFYASTYADVIAYFHSDLFIRERDWDVRVLKEFEDPSVVLVSFFGAKELGRANIYVDPYDFRQLARGGCYSNMRDWFNHGQRCTGSMDVAMIDSFSLIVRRSFLDLIGGWPMFAPPSHGSDMWICMMAARHKKKVRLVGIDCEHSSGGVRGDGKFDYPAWAATTNWGSDAAMHQWWHLYLYKEFRDVLPIRVP